MNKPERDPDTAVENDAIRLLARRDHSRFELATKLTDRGHDQAIVASVLDALESRGYLDDARFALRFAEQRVERGNGPLAIRARLRQRGIDEELQARALATLAVDWVALAEQGLERRFSVEDRASFEPRIRARLARHLAAKGFDGGVVRKATERQQRAAALLLTTR